jgi:hypothetical protein
MGKAKLKELKEQEGSLTRHLLNPARPPRYTDRSQSIDLPGADRRKVIYNEMPKISGKLILTKYNTAE